MISSCGQKSVEILIIYEALDGIFEIQGPEAK